MNYIWELAIHALQKGIDDNTIFYTIGQPFSAYMELSMIFLSSYLSQT